MRSFLCWSATGRRTSYCGFPFTPTVETYNGDPFCCGLDGVKTKSYWCYDCMLGSMNFDLCKHLSLRNRRSEEDPLLFLHPVPLLRFNKDQYFSLFTESLHKVFLPLVDFFNLRSIKRNFLLQLEKSLDERIRQISVFIILNFLF